MILKQNKIYRFHKYRYGQLEGELDFPYSICKNSQSSNNDCLSSTFKYIEQRVITTSDVQISTICTQCNNLSTFYFHANAEKIALEIETILL